MSILDESSYKLYIEIFISIEYNYIYERNKSLKTAYILRDLHEEIYIINKKWLMI